ncbi:glycoside hydrolase family 95 protein [Bacillus niameyensis]|uniref:glycoside hydrolase family 95 protein n=1 Tax=Bacillus niameyensis TaxID=1522308 RepID=UPI000784205D|nr:glycoside hydrolase family 95 protein [Bacillus niameyensis]
MNLLSYKKPATTWTEALPLGNGRIGAMHFGGIEVERFQLNEDTLWSGPPERKQYDDRESLSKVRKLIDEEKYEEAIDETKNMFGSYTQAYVPLGNLTIQHLHGQLAHTYQRQLDIEKAISSVKYSIGKVEYSREAFISNPNQVLVVKMTSSEENHLNLEVSLDSPLKSKSSNTHEEINIQGICPEYCAPNYFFEDKEPIIYGDFEVTKAIHFEGRLAVTVKSGQIQSHGGKLSIQNATEVILYLSVATSFQGFDQLPDKDFKILTKQNGDILSKAKSISYEQLKESHIQDYQQLFKRVHFSLKNPKQLENLDTDERVVKYGSNDLNMAALLFQYGRYLLISSSRSGTQPANLQGIWNNQTRAPWSSNYTLNINTEMNYWPAEVTNLAECHQPLLKAVKELSVSGSKMVNSRYRLKGWTAHHNTDIWRHADPVGGERHGDPVWAFWPMSGPWLTRHMWEHYEYSLDRDYLAEVYPIIKGSAEFCLDWLIEDENGYLITSPSTSPEHLFRTEDGKIGSVTKAATMDLEIIWDLFTNFLKATDVLNVEDELIQEVRTARERLHPLQIGKYGQLQEWLKDYEDVEIHHRHVSQLYGVYPSNHIIDGPLLDAVRQTLNRRGDAGTGWSLGWKICLWARLKDGERVNALFSQLFQIVSSGKEQMVGGGLYPNLFGAHPPFQIDGNFSYTAGVAEMLVQSHKGYIELLPALPSTWTQGSITGIRVRGGFEVGLTWEKMQMNRLEVSCLTGNAFVLKTDQTVIVHKENMEEERISPVDGLVSVTMVRGQKYIFDFA